MHTILAQVFKFHFKVSWLNCAIWNLYPNLTGKHRAYNCLLCKQSQAMFLQIMNCYNNNIWYLHLVNQSTCHILDIKKHLSSNWVYFPCIFHILVLFNKLENLMFSSYNLLHIFFIITKLLYSHPAVRDRAGLFPLHWANFNNSLIQQLCKHG